MSAAKINIAIDGHSACGKSTLARQLAAALGYTHIDTGAMYRAVTYAFLKSKIDTADGLAVESALKNMKIDVVDGDDHTGIWLNGQLLDRELRSTEVDNYVSAVAAQAIVRTNLVAQQQRIGCRGGIIMDGRDIGSIVLPDARLKLFVTASLEVRAKRRFEELQARNVMRSMDAVKENLLHRDHLDASRTTGPLVQVPEAVLIDNSNLTRQEQLAMVLALANCRISAIQSS